MNECYPPLAMENTTNPVVGDVAAPAPTNHSERDLKAQRAEQARDFVAQMHLKHSENGSMWAWRMAQLRVGECDDPVEEYGGLECWRYEDPQVAPVTKAFWMNEQELREWLSQDIPLSDGKPPSSGYKMIQINRPSNQPYFPGLPITMKSYDAVCQAFHIPPIELHMTSRRQGACGFFNNGDGSYRM